MKQFLADARLRPKEIKGVTVSSVVPDATTIFEQMCEKHIRISPVIISAALDLGMPIKYEHPRAVGADRLCNAVAAYDKYGGPCIVVDFGTATTYDVISKKGEYLGGVIAPGIETAGAELHRRASMLPKVDLQFPDKVVGTNTIGAIQAGILYGAIDAMEGMVNRIRKEIGARAIVIATGGFSTLVATRTEIIDRVEPSLVLDGARRIYERVKGKSQKLVSGKKKR